MFLDMLSVASEIQVISLLSVVSAVVIAAMFLSGYLRRRDVGILAVWKVVFMSLNLFIRKKFY